MLRLQRLLLGGCRPTALSADSRRSAIGHYRSLDRIGRRIVVVSRLLVADAERHTLRLPTETDSALSGDKVADDLETKERSGSSSDGAEDRQSGAR